MLHLAPLSTSLFGLNDAAPRYPSLRRLHLKVSLSSPVYALSLNPPGPNSLSTPIIVDQVPLLKSWLIGRESRVGLVLEDCDFSPMKIESLQEVATVTTL